MAIVPEELAPRLPELRLPGPHHSVGDRLEEVAGALGDAVALESAGRSLTYRTLAEQVRALAGELTAETSTAPVGVFAEQSVDSVVAMLGVMAAGRPCVVLDVRLPKARLVQVATRAGISVVLADDARRDSPAFAGVCPVRSLLPGGPDVPAGPLPAVTLDDAATIVYTSGSTGEPKGVVLRHATMLSTALIGRQRFGIEPGDGVSLVLPQAFAAGQEVVAMALLNGATLCVRDPRSTGRRELVDWLLTSRTTTLHVTPSLLRSVLGSLAPDELLTGVRLVTTCGEKVFGADAAAALRHLDRHGRFVNWLGSSETGMLATHEIVDGDVVPDGPLPAGHPVPTREVAVVGEDGAEVPSGTVGTMVVTSVYLPGGYWQEPAALADRFTALPDGRVRYRSGDRAQVTADGVLVLRGRADDAAKIRGYLVEPADVETAMRALPEVLDVVVRAVTDQTGEQRLVAWVVPDPTRRTPSPAALRADTAGSMPDYMVPRDVVLLTDLPRNERGKVDVAALPAPPPRPAPTPPVTPTERRLERIWADILRLDHVWRDESFTALGGDSLSVEEMLERVRGDLGPRLVSGDLAENPTLQQFAAVVDQAAAVRRLPRTSNLVRLRQSGSGTSVFCFAGAGGAAAFFEEFAAGLGPQRRVGSIQAHGFENRGLPDWTIGRAARRALEAVEEAGEGPLALVGHSLGGLIALRVAQLLTARGRSVSLLTLLDTFLPPAAKPADAPRTMGPVGRPITARELWAMRLRILGAGIVRYEQAVHTEVFHQQGTRVARFHRAAPWSGPALVYLSQENPDDPAWWSSLLTGEIDVRRIATDHLGLLRPPYVGEVAAAVRAELDAREVG
jgi:amino acid adenylation domain-containing protein